jgi:hypothetical protein
MTRWEVAATSRLQWVLHEYCHQEKLSDSDWLDQRSRVYPILDRYQKEEFHKLMAIANEYSRAFLAVWKQEQSGRRDPTLAAADAGRLAFLRFFKAMLKEMTVPEGLPFGTAWEQVETTHTVGAAVKKVRGKLNVPRERFWVTTAGTYRQASPFGK